MGSSSSSSDSGPRPTPPVFNVRDVLDFFLGNALILAVGILGGLALGLFIHSRMTPVYESTAKFVVDEIPYYQSQESTDAETERQLVQTLILSIASREMETAVCERLGLSPDQIAFVGFDPALPLRGAIPRANIRVDDIQNSRIGQIKVTSQFPEFAAEVANAILNELRYYNVIAGRLKNIRRSLLLAKDKVDSLQKSLIVASEERIRLDQQNAELDAYALRALPLDAFPAFAGDSTLNNLKTQLVLSDSEYKGLAATATRGNRLQAKQAELRALQGKLAGYLNQLVAGLRSERDIVTTAEADIKAEFEETRRHIDELTESATRFSQSFGDPAAMKALAVETAGSPGGQANVIVTIDPAAPRRKPVSPKLWLNLFAGLVFGTALGFGIAILRTLLDDKIKKPARIESIEGLHTLALIPKHTPLYKGVKRKNLFDHPEYPVDLGFLRSHLVGLSLADPSRSIIGFTSSNPKRSCSELVADLAILLAQSEKRTLVVDLHLGAPRQAELLGIETKQGLSEWLASDEPLAPYVSYSAVRELAVLSPGHNTQDLEDLLTRRPPLNALPGMLAEWDFILLDSPSILVDWGMAMTLPSGFPLLIGATYGKTSISMLAETSERARNQNWQILGVVLQDCPRSICPRKQRQPARI